MPGSSGSSTGFCSTSGVSLTAIVGSSPVPPGVAAGGGLPTERTANGPSAVGSVLSVVVQCDPGVPLAVGSLGAVDLVAAGDGQHDRGMGGRTELARHRDRARLQHCVDLDVDVGAAGLVRGAH